MLQKFTFLPVDEQTASLIMRPGTQSYRLFAQITHFMTVSWQLPDSPERVFELIFQAIFDFRISNEPSGCVIMAGP
jgi:hypothetical protein